VPDVAFAGGRVQAFLDNRADLEDQRGSELLVFLTRRSRVDVLRDGRLLTSGFYDAGQVRLPTRDLPTGAYPVTLRITDATGRSVEETRFFSKTNSIPPQDTDLWYVEGGALRNTNTEGAFPQTGSEGLFSLGYSHRLLDTVALSLSSSNTSKQQFLELGSYFFDDGLDVDAAALVSPKGDRGVSLSHFLSVDPFSLNASYRQFWAGERRDNTAAQDDPAVLLSGYSLDISGSISLTLEDAQLSWRAQWSEDSSGNSRYSQGSTARIPLWQQNLTQIDLELSAIRSNDESIALAQFKLFALQSRTSLNASGGVQQTKRSNTRTNDNPASATLAYTPNDRHTMRLSAAQEEGSGRGGAGYSYGGMAGRGTLDLDATGDTSRYAGTFAGNMLATAKGVSFGGRDSNQSGVIVRVLALENSEAQFEVFVNNNSYGTLKAGDNLPVTLPPYGKYAVQLKPIGAALSDFDTAARVVTLYPGNVERLEWQVRRLRVVAGVLLGGDGKPLIGAAVTGGITAVTTDSFGVFQTEVTSSTSLSADAGGKSCSITVPESTETVVYVGEIRCFAP
jgi:hypothetical protein